MTAFRVERIPKIRTTFLRHWPHCLYRWSKSLEVILWYWSFCYDHSPYYILLFTFPFRYGSIS